MPFGYDLVVIGAGAAGIAAARRLERSGLSILVLEASSRVGGRAFTARIEDLALDMGCGWLHSATRNPWVKIAEDMGFEVDRTPSAWHQNDLGFKGDLAAQKAAERDWQAWRERLDTHEFESDRAADALTPDSPWVGYAQVLSGVINGATLERVSIKDYLAYGRAAAGANWRVREGYGSLVAAGLPAVPMRLATPVTAIDTGGHRLGIVTRAGRIEARAAILTVSTDVLASDAIRLPPALDERKHAAACLPLGLADKLFFKIEKPGAFEPETQLTGDPRRDTSGNHYVRPLGQPFIESYFGGAGALMIEQAGLDGAFAIALDELAGVFGNEVRGSLRALAGSCWRRESWARGAYSHALPGEAHRRMELAAPWQDRLFFAGEATHPNDFSAAHGAFASGVRAAEEAMAALGVEPAA